MVARRLNKPVVKVGFYPVFWFNQVQRSEWNCRMCLERFHSVDSVAFEVLVRGAAPKANPRPPGDGAPGIKLFLCITCAEKLLQDALEKVQRVRAYGPDAHQFMEAL